MADGVELEIGGNSNDLQQAAEQAESSLDDLGSAAEASGSDMEQSAQSSNDLTSRLGHMGSAVDGAATAFEGVGAAAQAFADIQNMAAEKAARLERALNDVRQAQADYNQALLDGKQAQLDIGQAQIDAEQAAADVASAQKAYNEALASGDADAARQAAIDLKQAQQDLKQAGYDVEQANQDMTQSAIDAKSAQLDLAEAQKAADPSALQEIADTVEMLTPLLVGLASVVGIATAAQWLWNAAMTANPIGLIIVGIAALVAAIVLIATKTTWFQDLWETVWGGIVAYFKWVVGNYQKAWELIVTGVKWVGDNITKLPGLIKSAFVGLFNILTWPFRTAFNFIADAWNNTVGRLQWSVPSWVPAIGGNSIGAPRLPKFHQGGVMPGAPGTEGIALLQAGERITRANKVDDGTHVIIEFTGDVIEYLAGEVRSRGGSVQVLGVTANA